MSKVYNTYCLRKFILIQLCLLLVLSFPNVLAQQHSNWEKAIELSHQLSQKHLDYKTYTIEMVNGQEIANHIESFYISDSIKMEVDFFNDSIVEIFIDYFNAVGMDSLSIFVNPWISDSIFHQYDNDKHLVEDIEKLPKTIDTTAIRYNTQNKIIDKQIIQNQNNIKDECTTHYDYWKGLLIRETKKCPLQGATYSKEYQHNEKNDVSEIKHLKNFELISTETFRSVYYGNGKIKLKEHLHKMGDRLILHQEYSYNYFQGQEKEILYTNHLEGVESKTIKFFDSHSRLSRIEKTNLKTHKMEIWEFRYN